MNLFALVTACLLALSAPAAWMLVPDPAGGAPTGTPTTEATPAPPPDDADAQAGAAGVGTLRLRINNTGDAATVLVSVTDASGVPRIEARTLRARGATVIDYAAPLGEVTTEVHNGLAGGMATRDISGCASRVMMQNYTVAASATSWRIKVGGGWCVPAAS